jgi:hypothetical protein
MRFWMLTLLTTAGLLAAYTGLLQQTGWRAEYAESNVVANEIRWQRFERRRNAARIVVVGSSIGGRLPVEALVGDREKGINLCFDGSNARLGMELLAAAGVHPEWLFIEANTLTLPPSPNEATLRAAFSGFTGRLARAVPFLRAESRPVSLVYSVFKQRADRRRAAGKVIPDLSSEPRRPGPEPPRVAPVSDPAITSALTEWRGRLRPFRERGTQVVLVMLPDGGQDRARDYALARALAADGFLFFDLKGTWPEEVFAYSDGVHLVRPAAEALAAWLGRRTLSAHAP